MKLKRTRDGYAKALKKRGWREIGSGFFSEVYAKEGYDYVIKVGTGADLWEDYIIWATEQGYAGTLAPRVKCVHRYPHIIVALIERLDMTLNQLSCYGEDGDRRYANTLSAVRSAKFGGEEGRKYADKIVPGLFDFVRQLEKLGYAADMHDGNVMVKGERVVITDPASFGIPTYGMPHRWRAVGTTVFMQQLP